MTYHGAAGYRPWVAAVVDLTSGYAGPEAWGDDPIVALTGLGLPIGAAPPEGPGLAALADEPAFASWREAAAAWTLLGSSSPEGWLPGGITFGPAASGHRWRAFLIARTDWSVGEVAEGATPMRAAESLLRNVRPGS